MSSTNKTPNYKLPQFLGTDVPAWLGDVNPAYATIDAGMEANKNLAQTANNNAEGASNAASAADAKADKAQSTADGAVQQIGSLATSLKYECAQGIAESSVNLSSLGVFYSAILTNIKMTITMKTKDLWTLVPATNDYRINLFHTAENVLNLNKVNINDWMGSGTIIYTETNGTRISSPISVYGIWTGTQCEFYCVISKPTYDSIGSTSTPLIYGIFVYTSTAQVIPGPVPSTYTIL